MPAPVVNAYVSGGDLLVVSRDEEGRLHALRRRPEYVAYLEANEVDRELERALSNSRAVRSIKREGPWLRVGFADHEMRAIMVDGRKTSDGRQSPLIARGLKIYEGDVHPVRRYLSDEDIEIQKPRRCYLDIETDSRVPFSRKEEMRVLSWAVCSDDEDSIVSGLLREDTDEAEADLLRDLWGVLHGYDQVCAWHGSWTGEVFDFAVIIARSLKQKLRFDHERLLWLDYLVLFKKMNMHSAESGDEKQSMKIGNIGRALGIGGKDDFDSSKTWEAWAAGGEERARLLHYNERDVELLRLIEQKTGFAALFDTVARACTVFPDGKGLQVTTQMDGYLLRVGKQRGIRWPTKKYREGAAEKYEGAFVMQPKAKGVEREVHVCDFASLYPSIILSFNMSPETLAPVPVNGPIPEGHCRTPRTGVGFRTDVPGILPDALRDLMKLRKEWKKKKESLPPGTPEWVAADRWSTAYKVLVNSFYGGVGSPFTRFYSPQIAEGITTTGAWLIKATIAEAESDRWGMRVIYGDTDSCYVQNASRAKFTEFVDWCNAELYPRLTKQQGCAENAIKLAFEKTFSRIVFVSAKRYAGAYSFYGGTAAAADSKPEIKGLEFKRGDAGLLARRLQEQVVDLIIARACEEPQRCRDLVESLLDHVLNDTIPLEEAQLVKAITKPLKEYTPKTKKDGTAGAEPAHVRVARILLDRGEDVGEGSRIGYVVTNGDGGLKEIIPSSDYDGVTLDRYYLWEQLVYPPSQRFLQAAFPDSSWGGVLEKVRPPKPRRRGKPVPEEQGALLGESWMAVRSNGVARRANGTAIPTAPQASPTVNPQDNRIPWDPVAEVAQAPQLPARPIFTIPSREDAPGSPFTVVVREDWGAPLEALKDVFRAHPGPCSVEIRIVLESGAEATIAIPAGVRRSKEFHEDVDAVLWEAAATARWERSICGEGE